MKLALIEEKGQIVIYLNFRENERNIGGTLFSEIK